MTERHTESMRLAKLRKELEPVSPECHRIREEIARLEPCHESYVDNVKAILGMIGSMKPGCILGCGNARDARRKEASAYLWALERWRDGDGMPDRADHSTCDVFQHLGERTGAKLLLVNHLIGKLRDNGYRVYADEDEDFDLTESRIQHLDICNYNWERNLRIVLQEIAAGRRIFEWHVPGGFNTHGDCPNRLPELEGLIDAAAAWAEGETDTAGDRAHVLGESTPEKRWLVAVLCEVVQGHHKKFNIEGRLRTPAL